jgi:hypothetical protein
MVTASILAETLWPSLTRRRKIVETKNNEADAINKRGRFAEIQKTLDVTHTTSRKVNFA